ncbi:MAG: universal stress protein [Planctomycetota bacterium]
MNPQHILLPTDLSELSLRPLDHSPELFEGRRVTLLHFVTSASTVVEDEATDAPVDDPRVAGEMAEAREALAKIAAHLPASVEVALEVHAGREAGKDIASWAKKNGVDLIAISTHGLTGLRRFLIGSIAESVLKNATVPVLVFPARD